MIAMMMAAALAGTGDGPEISRSKGSADGVVVFWPRVVPEDPAMDELATKLQAKVATALGSNIDLRPMPERVCPQGGCRGKSVGVMLGHNQGGCVAVGLVNRPGEEGGVLVPLAGEVGLVSEQVGFRTPPETQLTVKEFVPCAELLATLSLTPLVTALEAQ